MAGIAHLQQENEQLRQLVRDCLALIQNRDAGFCTDEQEYQRCVQQTQEQARRLIGEEREVQL